MKRLTSLLLAVCLIAGMCSVYVSADATVSFTGSQLILGQDIATIFYTDATYASGLTLRTSLNGRDAVVNATNAGGKAAFRFNGIAPHEISSAITAAVYDGDTKLSDDLSYTVKSACQALLEDPLTSFSDEAREATYQLVSDLVQYGEAARVYHASSYPSITSGISTLPTYAPHDTSAVTADPRVDRGGDETLTVNGTAVYFGTVNCFYVRFTTNQDISTIKFVIDGQNGKKTFRSFTDEGGAYSFYTEAVYASKITGDIIIKGYVNDVETVSFTYGIKQYYDDLEGVSAESSMKNLAKSLYVYGEAAAEYLALVSSATSAPGDSGSGSGGGAGDPVDPGDLGSGSGSGPDLSTPVTDLRNTRWQMDSTKMNDTSYSYVAFDVPAGTTVTFVNSDTEYVIQYPDGGFIEYGDDYGDTAGFQFGISAGSAPADADDVWFPTNSNVSTPTVYYGCGSGLTSYTADWYGGHLTDCSDFEITFPDVEFVDATALSVFNTYGIRQAYTPGPSPSITPVVLEPGHAYVFYNIESDHFVEQSTHAEFYRSSSASYSVNRPSGACSTRCIVAPTMSTIQGCEVVDISSLADGSGDYLYIVVQNASDITMHGCGNTTNWLGAYTSYGNWREAHLAIYTNPGGNLQFDTLEEIAADFVAPSYRVYNPSPDQYWHWCSNKEFDRFATEFTEDMIVVVFLNGYCED